MKTASNRKKINKAVLIVFAIIIVAVLLLIKKGEGDQYAALTQSQKDSIERKETMDKAYEKIEPELIKSIKALLNDPKSFENVQAGYYDIGTDTLIIKMTFSVKNALNATITHHAFAKGLLDGSLISSNIED